MNFTYKRCLVITILGKRKECITNKIQLDLAHQGFQKKQKLFKAKVVTHHFRKPSPQKVIGS